MRLTRFSDYALRTLLYLGVNDCRLVPLAEVARAYGISYNHLVKVGALLANLGVVEPVRGRGGGLRLAVQPGELNVGWLVRRTESDFHLVECFDADTDTCPITPACGLRHALLEAQQNFLETLDQYTLAHFLASPGRQAALIQLWDGSQKT